MWLVKLKTIFEYDKFVAPFINPIVSTTITILVTIIALIVLVKLFRRFKVVKFFLGARRKLNDEPRELD